MKEDILINEKEKIIMKFKSDYRDLTGFYPEIKITESLYITSVNLRKIESIVNTYIPSNLIKKNIATIKVVLRKREICDLRFIFCYIANKKYGFKHKTIGEYLKQDRTTVINACNQAENLIKTDSSFINLYEEIYANVKLIYKNGAELLQPTAEKSANTKSTLHSVLL